MADFYNTLHKKKEAFTPLNPGKVGLYVCGPTVYDFAHVGNIRAYVFSDILRRVLEDEGYEVRMIKNITDVGHLTADDVNQGDSGEDKMIKKALKEGKTPFEIALFYEDYFHGMEKAMNILPAHYFPRATKHIQEIIRMIETLIAKGHAYEVNGNVFYDVTSFTNYGQLSGNKLENLQTGARLEEHPDKRNAWDFALWLKAPAGHLMHWSSPWSEGYPGWHIECSAMSQEYLGDTLDIHTGGEDHIFPHHEAEIAQSEGTTDKLFSRFFLHVRHMLIDDERMAKSKGNFYTLEDIVEKGYTAMDLRMLFLGAHYRSQMNFTWDGLAQAKKNRETLENTYRRLVRDTSNSVTSGYRGDEEFEHIREALRDDLNTPLALTHALELSRKTNTALDNSETLDKERLVVVFDAVFDLFGLRKVVEEALPETVTTLLKEREVARSAKDFALSDTLRDELDALGYKVEDTAKGQVATKK
jgi:cysteinyl-tRNA synthetase